MEPIFIPNRETNLALNMLASAIQGSYEDFLPLHVRRQAAKAVYQIVVDWFGDVEPVPPEQVEASRTRLRELKDDLIGWKITQD